MEIFHRFNSPAGKVLTFQRDIYISLITINMPRAHSAGDGRIGQCFEEYFESVRHKLPDPVGRHCQVNGTPVVCLITKSTLPSLEGQVRHTLSILASNTVT